MITYHYDGWASAESHYTTHSSKTYTGREKHGVSTRQSLHTVPPTHCRNPFGSQTGDTWTCVKWIPEFTVTGLLRNLCNFGMNLFCAHIHVVLKTFGLLIGCAKCLLLGLMGPRNQTTVRPTATRTPLRPICTICGIRITVEHRHPEYWRRKCAKCGQQYCWDCSDRVLHCGNPCEMYSEQHRRAPNSTSLSYPPTFQEFIDEHPDCKECLRLENLLPPTHFNTTG